MSDTTTIHTSDTYKVREFRADGTEFSTWGSYDELGNKFHGAVHALNEAESMQSGRPIDGQHTFKIIRTTTTVTETPLDD